MRISAALAWYWVWAEISGEQFSAATAARKRLGESPAGQQHVPMTEEFHASLLAITACAYSLDALDNALLLDEAILAAKPNLPAKQNGRKTRRDEYVFALLQKVCRTSV